MWQHLISPTNTSTPSRITNFSGVARFLTRSKPINEIHVYPVTYCTTIASGLLQRSDYLRREVLKMIRSFPNAAVAPWSMATIWGGASLLKMLLKCMEDLMAKKDWKWDFFINLSESDYPIK